MKKTNSKNFTKNEVATDGNECKPLSIKKKEWEYKAKVVYEFTINFNDEYQCIKALKDLDERHDRPTIYLKQALNKTGVFYYLVPEYSMPQFGDSYKNKCPRFHYHGIILFPSERSVCSALINMHVWFSYIGRYQYNVFRPDHWYDYCHKHRDIFASIPIIKNASWSRIVNLKCLEDKLNYLIKPKRNNTFKATQKTFDGKTVDPFDSDYEEYSDDERNL